MANSAAWLKGLRQCLTRKQLVEIDRKPLSDESTSGFVVGMSDSFISIHLVVSDYLLNGYTVYPISDIKRYRVVTKWNSIMARTLKARNLGPVPQPKLSLVSTRSILESANRLFPLVTIFREKMSRDKCWIGKIASTTDRTFQLHEIDPGAKFDVTRRYRFADITQINFDGEYERALWLVNQSGSKQNRRRRNR